MAFYKQGNRKYSVPIATGNSLASFTNGGVVNIAATKNDSTNP